MTPGSIEDAELQRGAARRNARKPGRRGPKQSLSTATVVDAAITLADASGVAALSMRKVAEAIGVSPMSLYTYVPSKAELVDLMFDRVLADTADPDETITGWREKLAFIAHERWALSERHPWLLDLALHRPPLSPNVMRKAQLMLSAMEGMGLEPEEAGLAAETLQNYITGALRSDRDAREAQKLSGLSDEAWFALAGPALEKHLDPRNVDTMRRISEAKLRQTRSPVERAKRFAFGLERVLDGLDLFIRESRRSA